MNKKIVLGFTVLTILFVGMFSGCSSKNPVTPVKEVTTNIVKESVKDISKDTTPTPLTQLKYIIVKIPSSTKIELNTPWETSSSGESKATIEGKGENATEEGYSQIIIENRKSGELTKLTMKNEEKSSLTAKDLEWMDDSNLFVIIGQPFGTVSKGGKIYKLNITTGEASLYTDNKNSKEEFTAVHKSASGFTFEKYVYDDDNFIKGHVESGKLELK